MPAIEISVIVFGFLAFFVEFKINLDVARTFRTKMFTENHHETAKSTPSDHGLLENFAKVLAAVTRVRHEMITTVSVVYVVGLVAFIGAFPLSWRTGFFLATLFGHCFLLWMAQVHVQKVRTHVRRLPPEYQIEVFRLTKLYQTAQSRTS